MVYCPNQDAYCSSSITCLLSRNHLRSCVESWWICVVNYESLFSRKDDSLIMKLIDTICSIVCWIAWIWLTLSMFLQKLAMLKYTQLIAVPTEWLLMIHDLFVFLSVEAEVLEAVVEFSILKTGEVESRKPSERSTGLLPSTSNFAHTYCAGRFYSST